MKSITKKLKAITKVKPKSVIKQKWEETEKGWGVRPDGYSLHLNKEDRDQYIKDYWEPMPESTPDEYSRPSGDGTIVDIDEDQYKELLTSKNGIRFC